MGRNGGIKDLHHILNGTISVQTTRPIDAITTRRHNRSNTVL